MQAETRLPTPVASRSLFRSDVLRAGSMASTASTLRVDSMVPTSANMMMYLIEAALMIAEKSGKVTALSSEPGRLTRNSGPIEWFCPQAE